MGDQADSASARAGFVTVVAGNSAGTHTWVRAMMPSIGLRSLNNILGPSFSIPVAKLRCYRGPRRNCSVTCATQRRVSSTPEDVVWPVKTPSGRTLIYGRESRRLHARATDKEARKAKRQPSTRVALHSNAPPPLDSALAHFLRRFTRWAARLVMEHS